MKLTHDMFQELAQIYPGPFLHLGADETQELGKGQTKAEVDSRGLGAVYLDFMAKIVADLQPLNRKLLFWGDIAYHEPDLLKQMPDSFKKATIAVAWEYNPQPKGFDRFIKPFTDAKFETWVAPGVNNWSRVYPNYNNGLSNIQQFTADGQKLGATGQLNTIWNDDGEALVNGDWYGVLFGAEACMASSGEAPIPTFQSSYGENFHGDLTGKIDEAQREMMATHKLLKDLAIQGRRAGSALLAGPWNADAASASQVKLRPILASELRMHAEKKRAHPRRRSTKCQSRTCARPMPFDVLELGARRAWTSSA